MRAVTIDLSVEELNALIGFTSLAAPPWLPLGDLAALGEEARDASMATACRSLLARGLLEDEAEPIAAEVRSLLDGHINLSRKPPTG